jgi:hypothetical protein
MIKDYDDKDLVIVAIFVLCMVAMFIKPDQTVANLIGNGFSGLFGIAVGKSIK